MREVQERNIAALIDIVKENKESNIVIATHGTALSTIIQYYSEDFGYDDFHRIKDFMPYIWCIELEDGNVKKIEEFII
ncbi:Histidine phosphatase superfamily (branch 1) [Clostridium grantii DSM 8605]|uniref:Histidine phosphatase superfamily (Branch 1) n=1 Tax=Clostridium grantii DSM 8605 TaxID=1121316 RepID=A0A1M5VLS7_9CLOT|nr:Histidine phosphatase superfamily (branch 1) [Clostridium grantii DSM 8605]